jgi:glycosyltransferase involved in cell wall biosynthesis
MTSPTVNAPAGACKVRETRNALRILMYTAYFAPEYSGAALQALTLASELRRRGHHVEFVTNRWDGLPERDVVDGFAVYRVEPGRLRKHREFRLWLNLARYAWSRRRDFDIVHSHGAYYTHSFLGLLAPILGWSSVAKASLANDDLHDISQPLIGRIHAFMLRRMDACIGISQDLVKEFEAAGVDRRKIHYIPNGVDTGRFRPIAKPDKTSLRAAMQLPAAQPIVLYVGVMDRRKNILWLAEQWVSNDAFGTGALLLAVGPQSRDDPMGELRSRLLALADEHPTRFRVHDFRTDIAPYYRCADALVLPSVNEGLPNVVLEAMAAGLPCVVARASGSRELIVEGQNGWMYAPDDSCSLAESIRRCLSGDGAAMGTRARHYALERYSLEAVVSRYAVLYAQLLARRPLRAVSRFRTAARLPTAKPVVYVENGIGYGGAVTCLRHLVRALDRSRFDPIVVTGQSSDPYAGIAEDARWFCIPDRRIDVGALRRNLGSSATPDAVPGLRTLLLQLIARLDDAANFLPFFLRLTWFLVRVRPALVHVNNEPLCNRAAVLAASMLRIPLVCHVRGDQFGSRSMALLFRLPDRFIPVSRWIAESIGRFGVRQRDSTLIYDGLDFGRFDGAAGGSEFRSRFGIPENAFAIGLPGVLIPWKGQAMFLEAARQLVSELPDARFVVIGGTPDECAPFEQELRDFVATRNLQRNVVFTGHVDDMASVYSALDVVVSASTSPEPLGMVVVEAMAMGRAVIAPSHGGALEVIDDERTGLLFTPNDAASLASAVRRLYDDEALRVKLASAGRAAVIDKFSIANSARAVEAVYGQVLGTP